MGLRASRPSVKDNHPSEQNCLNDFSLKWAGRLSPPEGGVLLGKDIPRPEDSLPDCEKPGWSRKPAESESPTDCLPHTSSGVAVILAPAPKHRPLAPERTGTRTPRSAQLRTETHAQRVLQIAPIELPPRAARTLLTLYSAPVCRASEQWSTVTQSNGPLCNEPT
jgi:hypothetical protein